MCKFFSVISDGKGKIYYFDWAIRERIIKKELSYESDSHTSIADYYGFKGSAEDKMNKYEYNPLTKGLTVDQINTDNDSVAVEKQCNNLDFSKIVPALIIKKIVNPLLDVKAGKVGKKEKELLKNWASLWASVRASMGEYYVGESLWASLWASVGASAWESLGASLGASGRTSAWASVWASVRASAWAYYSSFFSVKYEYDFSCGVELWNRGFVPSFDGKIWRLHAGKKGEVVFEITAEELRKIK